MIIFEGNDRLAYRDPTCYYHNGVYHLFFTVSEKEDGYLYNRIGKSESTDLVHWSQPHLLTEKDYTKNYCSPGNVIEQGGHFVICFTSYPMPFPYAERDCADETARLFTMETEDFIHFSEPKLLNPKGDTPVEELGRMIDPYLLPVEEGFHLFFKQNGVSHAFSQDLVRWEYRGHIDGGENACVFRHDGSYILVHSPENGIAFSRSDDAMHWEPFSYTTLDQENWPWAAERVTAGFVMEMPAGSAHRYLLFFHGSRPVYPETHGNASLALAYTDDLHTFFYE